MNNTNHPDLKRLEQLLKENPTWAVKITDVNRGNEKQYLQVNGKKTLWIHHEHLPNGLQQHVVNLAKDRNIKKLGFEIKRHNGTSNGRKNYTAPGKSSLSNPYFSISFTSQNNEHVKNTGTDTAFAKAEPQQRIETPKMEPSTFSGLSGAQVMEFMGNTIHKSYLERDLAKIEAENTVLKPENERLKARVLELENEKEKFEKPKSVDKIFDGIKENPEIIKQFFGGISMLMPKEKEGSGLQGSTQTVEPERSPQKVKLINHIDEHNDAQAQKLGDVALFIEKDDEFASALADLVKKAYSKLFKTA